MRAPLQIDCVGVPLVGTLDLRNLLICEVIRLMAPERLFTVFWPLDRFLPTVQSTFPTPPPPLHD
jgi:hypothetical protein